MKVDSHRPTYPPRPEALRPSPPPQSRSADATTFDLKDGVTREFLQSALTTEIGKQVQDVLGRNGISITDAAGLDWSAEATSDRIVVGTTSLLATFARKHPDLQGQELLDAFERTIRRGIDTGYGHALSILEAVSTFSPEVKDLGQRTIAMTHEKLTKWFAEQAQQLAAPAVAEASAPA